MLVGIVLAKFLVPFGNHLYSPWGRFVPNFTLFSANERFYPNPDLSFLLYNIVAHVKCCFLSLNFIFQGDSEVLMCLKNSHWYLVGLATHTLVRGGETLRLYSSTKAHDTWLNDTIRRLSLLSHRSHGLEKLTGHFRSNHKFSVAHDDWHERFNR